MNPQPDIMTLKDLADYLRCSERHIYNLTRLGLPHFYLGSLLRFRREEISAFLSATKQIGNGRRKTGLGQREVAQ